MKTSIRYLHSLDGEQKQRLKAHLGELGTAVTVHGSAGMGRSTILAAMAEDSRALGRAVITIPQGFDFAVCSDAANERLTTIPLGPDHIHRVADFILERARHGTLIVIDDVNELESDHCRRLRSLLRGVGHCLTVAISIRSQLGCSGQAGRLVDDLHQLLSTQTIMLEPWTPATVVEWTTDAFDAPLGLEAAASIIEWTGGLAGWTTQWITRLHQQGGLQLVDHHLELTTDLATAALAMEDEVRRYLEPASDDRWTVVGLLSTTGPLSVDQLDAIGAILRPSAQPLLAATSRLLDEAVLARHRDHAVHFTNHLIEAVASHVFYSNSSYCAQVADAVSSLANVDQDTHLAAALCRLANATSSIDLDPARLLRAAERVATVQPMLARKAIAAAVAGTDDRSTGQKARRLEILIDAIDPPDVAARLSTATPPDRKSALAELVAEAERAHLQRDRTGLVHALDALGLFFKAEDDSLESPTLPTGLTGLDLDHRRRPHRRQTDRPTEVVRSLDGHRRVASPIHRVRLDLELVEYLMSRARPFDAQPTLAALVDERLAGSLGRRVDALAQLHAVMTGNPVTVADLANQRRVSDSSKDDIDPVDYCRLAFLGLRRPQQRRRLPNRSPQVAPKIWRPMIQWVEELADGPTVLDLGDQPDPLNQFCSFVEQRFVDGALLVAPLVDQSLLSMATKRDFRQLVVASWASTKPVGRRSTTPSDLEPFNHEIARLVASGMTNAEVADQLGVSINTVSNRLKRIYKSLGVRNRTALRGVVERTLEPATASTR